MERNEGERLGHRFEEVIKKTSTEYHYEFQFIIITTTSYEYTQRWNGWRTPSEIFRAKHHRIEHGRRLYKAKRVLTRARWFLTEKNNEVIYV